MPDIVGLHLVLGGVRPGGIVDEVHPPAANLDIRFIAAPGAPDRSSEMPPAVGQLGRIPNDPAQNRARRDADAQLTHDLSQIAVAELEPQIPGD